MSMQVESRVVELIFDNSRFQKNIQDSLSSINEIEGKLDGKKSFNFATALSAAGDSARALTERFSTMGIIGSRILENLADKAFELASSMFNMLTAPLRQVNSGGLSRALTMEQARFRMEGIVGDAEKVDDVINKGILPGILKTPFALDQAAGVMSIILSSNRKWADSAEGLEKMATVTRAISGAAAMAGTDFQQMGNIFADVASQGYVSGQALTRLEMQSIPATQLLMEHYGKTSEEIDKMIAKHQISFDEFAKIMDDAYGEHALESLKTFNGALEDVKAALSRVGAAFYTPMLKHARDILNSLTPVIDNFNTILTSFFKSIDSRAGVATEKITKFFGMFDYIGKRSEFLADLEAQKRGVEKFKENGEDYTEEYSKILDKISSRIEGKMENNEYTLAEYFSRAAEYLGFPEDKVKRVYIIVDDLASLFTSFGRVLKAVGGYISKFFSIMSQAFNEKFASIFDFIRQDLWKLSNSLTVLSSYLSMNEKTASAWMSVFRGIFGLLSHGVKIIIDVVAEIIKAFTTVLKDSKIPDLLKQIGEKLQIIGLTFKGHSKIADTIGKVYKAMFRIIDFGISLVLKLADVFLSLVAVFTPVGRAVNKVTGAFAELIDTIFEKISKLNLLQSIGNAIAAFLHKIGEVFSWIANIITNFGTYLEKASNWITEHISALASGDFSSMLAIWTMFTQGFDSVVDTLVEKLTKAEEGGKKFTDSLKGFLTGVDDSLGVLPKIGKSITDFLNQIGEVLKAYQKNLEAGALVKIAIAIAILAGTIFLLTKINPDNLLGAVSTLGILMIGLYWVAQKMSSTTSILGSIKKKELKASKSNVMELVKIAAALAILVGSVKVLASLNPISMLIGIGGVALLLGALYGVLYGVNALSKDKKGDPKKAMKAAKGLIPFAIAVRILVSSVSILGSMDTDALIQGLKGVSILMFELWLFIAGLTLLNGSDKKVKVGIMNMLSLLILAAVIKKLCASVEFLGSLPIEQWAKGLAGVGIILAELAGFSAIMSLQKGKGKLIMMSISMLALSKGLSALLPVVKDLGALSDDAFLKGLGGLALLLGEIAIAANLMKGTLLASVAMIAMAAGVGMLVGSLKILGEMDTGALIQGIVGLAVAIAMLMGFAALFSPLALSVAIFTAELILLGVGLSFFGAGLTAIGVGLSSIGVGLMTLVSDFAIIKGIFAKSPIEDKDVKNLKTSFKNLGTCVGSFFDGASESMGENKGAMKTMIGSLVVSGSESLTENTPVILDTVQNFGGQLKDKLIEQAPALANGAFDIVISLINGLGEAFATHGEDLRNAIINLGKGMLQGIKDFFGIHSPSSVMIEIGGFILQGLVKGIAAAPMALWNGVKSVFQSAKNKFIEWGKGLFGIGEDYMEVLVEGITSETEMVGDTVNDALLDAAKKDPKIAAALEKQGKGYILDMDSGMESKKSTIKNTAASIAKSGKNSAGTISWYSTGQDAAEGFKDGIKSKVQAIVNASHDIASAAIKEARETLEEHSPSKVFMGMGAYASEGLAIGISNNKSLAKVAFAANKIVNYALDTANDSIETFNLAAEINDAFYGLDTNPTIRPVLDLTDIESGAQRIGNLMPTSTIGVVSGDQAIAASKIQNGLRLNTSGQSTTNNTTNSPVYNLTFHVDGSNNPKAYAQELASELKRLALA